MKDMLKLLSSQDVCEMLGISKSTLYRWNNLYYEEDLSNASLKYLLNSGKAKYSSIFATDEDNTEISDIAQNFPRPFKIGRAYKWRKDEILDWLETVRVK